MSNQEIATPPPVIWAQRIGLVLVTINVEDCKDQELKIEKNSIYFRGIGGPDNKHYELTINLYKEIDPDKSKSNPRGRCIELILAKASTEGGYWPTLTSDKVKHHWLKIDFNKWRDEDESDEEGGAPGGMMGGGMGGGGGGDFEEMMRQMGGLGAGGGGRPNFDDLDAGDGDSDDEELPSLE